MEPIIMDVDDRPTNAPDNTPLPPTLFLQWVPSLNPNWSGQLEKYSSIFDVQNLEDLSHRIQHKEDWDLYFSDTYADATTCDVVEEESPGELDLTNHSLMDWDKISIRHLPIPHPKPTNEIPASPPMSPPSLSRSSGSLTESSSDTTPTVHDSGQRTSAFNLRLAKKPQCRRFTVEQTKVLETWLLSHSSNPYPNHEEKQTLATCTSLSIRQVETWLSRARLRKRIQSSPFQIRLPTTSILEEPPSLSPLRRSSLIIEAEGEPVIPESSSITLEPKVSENSEGGTHIAPPKVNGERITSSLSVLVNAVVLFQRLDRTRPRKLDEATVPPVNAVPAAASRPSLGATLEMQSGGGVNMELWLSQSQESLSSSPETDSVNSFEDDFPENSSRDENSPADEDRNATMRCWSTYDSLNSETMLSMLRPLYATLPDEISQSITRDLTLLFDSWALRGSLERPSYPPSSSSSTPPRSQANGSTGGSTEHTSTSDRGKKRPLRDGSESPGDGNDDKNGDETRKRLRLNSQSQEDIALRWACPFYQRSPYYYCVETEYGDYRKCAKSPGFSGVHRVKDHIYRCHASIYCDRCYSVFKNEDDLTAHRRDLSPCTVQDPRPMQGLTNKQKKLLKPRDRNKSEEARWNTLYKICFPNDEFVPSPYYIFYSRETAELRRDVFDIIQEETRSLDDTVRDRIHERLQHAFNNVQMRSSLGTTRLPTPPSSEIFSQQSWESGPSPRLPLASRSAVLTSINHQAISTVTAEPGHKAPSQDPPFGEWQGYDPDDMLNDSNDWISRYC